MAPMTAPVMQSSVARPTQRNLVLATALTLKICTARWSSSSRRVRRLSSLTNACDEPCARMLS